MLESACLLKVIGNALKVFMQYPLCLGLWVFLILYDHFSSPLLTMLVKQLNALSARSYLGRVKNGLNLPVEIYLLLEMRLIISG